MTEKLDERIQGLKDADLREDAFSDVGLLAYTRQKSWRTEALAIIAELQQLYDLEVKHGRDTAGTINAALQKEREKVAELEGRLRLQTEINQRLESAGIEVGAQLKASQEREKKLGEVLRALVNKMNLVHEDERYQSVWILAGNRGMPYNGPTYEAEFKAAEEALRQRSGNDNDLA